MAIVLTGIDHLALAVRDVEATCAFYERLFGLRRRSSGGTALHGDGFAIHLHEATMEPNVRAAAPGSADVCLITSLPLAEVQTHLAACGVPVVDGPMRRRGPGGALASLYVRDPDHHLIEIAHPAAAEGLPVYGRRARYYDAILDAVGKDYGAEATALVELVQDHGVVPGRLLDVACGTGRHLAALTGVFARVAGVDASDDMLAVARALVPDATLALGDFRTFELGETFDVVTCLFSAIGHVDDADDLDRVVARLAAHVAPGGLLVVEPWLTPELVVDGGLRHAVSTTVGDEAVSRTSRSYVDGEVVVVDWMWTVATPQGLRAERETHRMPLFPRDRYVEALTTAGLEASWRDHPMFRRGLVTGRRPRSTTEDGSP